jgi:hypothetical protein
VKPAAWRAVLLGASNLSAALPSLVDDLRHAAGGPVEVLAACGHGRSYGNPSRFLFARRLPGIASCGLWAALERHPPLPSLQTIALLTDVGNDLAYGEMPATIAGWVDSCLGRLSGLGAATICTPLPLCSLEKMSALRYYAARSILFPGRRVPWRALLERARELDGRLRDLTCRHGALAIEPEAAWYGMDPIHVRRRWRRRVWQLILSQWPLPGPVVLERRERPRPVSLPLLGAEEQHLFGLPRRHPQPARRFADGTTVALY